MVELTLTTMVVLGAAGCSAIPAGLSRMAANEPRRPGSSTSKPDEGRAYRGSTEFKATPAAVAEAATQAMADLKMSASSTRHDGAVIQVLGETADQRAVTVTIRPGVAATRISSRIGWFGDPPLSEALTERTGIRLGAFPPKPIPENPPSEPSSNPYFSRGAIPDEIMYRDLVDAPYRDRVVP
jgi:hypothetical protein